MSVTGKIRIVAGSAGGLWIKIPKKFPSRPTQDRIKQAIFSSLGSRIPGSRVIDLFAGTGNLGIEALSRGADSALFVEQNKNCTAIIKENLTYCKLEGNVIAESVETFLARQKEPLACDICFLDPPYSKKPEQLNETVLYTSLAQVIPSQALVIWEHASHDYFKESIDFKLLKHNRYGETSVLFLEKA